MVARVMSLGTPLERVRGRVLETPLEKVCELRSCRWKLCWRELLSCNLQSVYCTWPSKGERNGFSRKKCIVLRFLRSNDDELLHYAWRRELHCPGYSLLRSCEGHPAIDNISTDL